MAVGFSPNVTTPVEASAPLTEGCPQQPFPPGLQLVGIATVARCSSGITARVFPVASAIRSGAGSTDNGWHGMGLRGEDSMHGHAEQ